jgi:hypothetical protein
MNIKTATIEKLNKRLKYLVATGREYKPEAMHIKGQIRKRST